VGIFHAPEFARDDFNRLVPADGLVTGLAPGLRIAFATGTGIEIHPLERRPDAILGIQPVSLGKDEGRKIEFPGRRVALSVGLDGPGPEVALLGHQGTDTDDLPVLHSDRYRAGIGATGEILCGHVLGPRRAPTYLPGLWV
jgi:hypothetical protein